MFHERSRALSLPQNTICHFLLGETQVEVEKGEESIKTEVLQVSKQNYIAQSAQSTSSIITGKLRAFCLPYPL
jgi:hypothetical protein